MMRSISLPFYPGGWSWPYEIGMVKAMAPAVIFVETAPQIPGVHREAEFSATRIAFLILLSCSLILPAPLSRQQRPRIRQIPSAS